MPEKFEQQDFEEKLFEEPKKPEDGLEECPHCHDSGDFCQYCKPGMKGPNLREILKRNSQKKDKHAA